MVEELAKVPPNQRVMLVGHSAGAIFVCELLQRLAQTDRKVEVVFLAPAARCELFSTSVIANQQVLATNNGHQAFRMFTMSDEFESKDTLIRNLPVVGDLTWFYPRSLLYFISGLLEGDANDADVLGLERSHTSTVWYGNDNHVLGSRDWVSSPRDRVSWSISTSVVPGMMTNSSSHGGFGTPGDNNTTMDSVAELVRSGWH
jgi:triacylglycerol esterase/lipase EstA (alpha/beta hydrolase family)